MFQTSADKDKDKKTKKKGKFITKAFLCCIQRQAYNSSVVFFLAKADESDDSESEKEEKTKKKKGKGKKKKVLDFKQINHNILVT